MDEGLHILGALVQVEFVTCFQGKTQGILVFLQVIEDFRGDRGG
jgi:hypothetical protein